MRFLQAGTSLLMLLSLLAVHPCSCATDTPGARTDKHVSEHRCCHPSPKEEEHLPAGISGCLDCAMADTDCGSSSTCCEKFEQEAIVDRDELTLVGALMAARRSFVTGHPSFEHTTPVRDLVPHTHRSEFPTVMLC